MQDQMTIQTTRLDYKLNLMALQSDYRFLQVTVKEGAFSNYNKLIASWLPEAVMTPRRNMYVLMFRQLPLLQQVEKLEMREIMLAEMETDSIYPNHILQLLLNQQAFGQPAISEVNKTPELLVSRKEWQYQRQDLRRQCHALNVKVNWDQDLELNVQTYTETAEWDWKRPLYKLDLARGFLERCYQPSDGPYFYQGNHTSRKNQVKFLSIKNLKSFERSKVGIARALLDNLNQNTTRYLSKSVKFHQSQVEQSCQLKLERTDAIWKQIAGCSINIYPQANDSLAAELANRMTAALKQSQIVQQVKVNIHCSRSSQSGLNIQVIRDTRDHAKYDHYEVGTVDRIIQHVTVEKFGAYQKGDEGVSWEPHDGKKSRDAATDPALIKLAQELCIKQDLANRQLTMVDAALARKIQPFTFYRFEYIRELPAPEVMVTKLAFTMTMGLVFSKKQVVLKADHLKTDDEYTRICDKVFKVLGSKKQKYIWDRVDCVVQFGTKQIMIQQFARTTMPDGEQIKKQLELCNPNKILSRKNAGQELERVRPIDADDEAFMTAFKQLQSVVAESPSTFNLKDLDQAARDAGLNPRQPGMRQVNQFLEAKASFTLKSTLQRNLPDSPLLGLKWIGLTRIEEWNGYSIAQYFVGANQSLKPDIARAVTLRRLLPLSYGDKVVDEVFPELAAMMSVEFVRNGQYTVVPFPVKYLREYWLAEQREHPEYRWKRLPSDRS